jgi:tetratricopeptide (TPR) repeat protein
MRTRHVSPASIRRAPRADRLKSLWFPVLLAVVFSWPSACAHAPAPARDAVLRERSAAADGLAARGCYRCLQEATGIYEQLLAERFRAPVTAQKAHDTFMMLALRERELGVPDSRAGVKAHQVAGLATAASHDLCQFLLSVLASPSTEGRVLPDGRDDPRDDHNGLAQRLQREWPRSVAHAYGYIALDCWLTLPAELRPRTEDLFAAYPDSLALKYRHFLCQTPLREETARELLRTEPRFSELYLTMAQHALGERRLVSAHAHLTRAFEAIPESRAIALTLADVALGLVRFDEALRLYDHVLAAAPDREAVLGRVKALTYLNRSDEAIATIDSLIGDSEWSPGEKYYWRALNNLRRSALDAAYRDATIAMQSWPGPPVYRLAGIAAFMLGRLPDARRHLQSSIEMDGDDCEALLHLGYIDAAEQAWTAALGRFRSAATCFGASAQRASAGASAPGTDPSIQDGLAAGVRTAVAEALALQAAAHFNGALAAKMLGNREQALELARRALSDPKYGGLAKDFILDIDLIGRLK